MSNQYVALQNITLAYGKSIAVPNLDLNIKQGELIALLGPSGCGKTTTMRAIAGLMTPTEGQIMIDGKDVTHVPANKRGIGLVFQSYALFPHLSCFENVAFGLRIKKLNASEIKTQVEKGLATVGLSHLASRKPAEMSGGQQQRLSLARSLVMEPKVLLLDEPLSNLDARLRLEMRTELQRVQRETGVTMVFVTHDQTEALAIADRIVLMRDGIIEQVGTPDELYNQPVSPFIADFLGYENIFAVEGNIISSKSGSLRLNFSTDAKTLGWRPSGVSIGEGEFNGKIKAVAFAGEHREYIIDSQIGEIRGDVSAEKPGFKIGEQIVFDLPKTSATEMFREMDIKN